MPKDNLSNYTILNSGENAWLFESFASKLAKVLWLNISETPAEYNYILGCNESDLIDSLPAEATFISYRGMKLASDKRLLAEAFNLHKLPTPETYLIDREEEIQLYLNKYSDREWCLKYPTSCGGSGHRIITDMKDIPPDFPKPYVLQRFIRQAEPKVYRVYCAGGKLFGWNLRQFKEGDLHKPWVAHALGATYHILNELPPEVREIATHALKITDLFTSFGCVDLIQAEDEKWLVLEVGTDGIFGHVDRQIGDRDLELEIDRSLAETFWSHSSIKPWGNGSWYERCI